MMPGPMDQEALLRQFFQQQGGQGGPPPQGGIAAGGAGAMPSFDVDQLAQYGVRPPQGGAGPLPPPGMGGSAQPLPPGGGGRAMPLGADQLPPAPMMPRGGAQQLPPAPRGPGGGAQPLPIQPQGRMPADVAPGVGGGPPRGMGGPPVGEAMPPPMDEDKKRRLIEAIMRASGG
jgi:hypothetical protein